MSPPSPKIVSLIQARMSSSRLPGKSLREMLGRPMLQLMLERVSGVEGVETIVLTSLDASDDPIEALCDDLGYRCLRGSLDDVLGRYVMAVEELEPEIAIRLTGDNPIIDARAVRAGIEAYRVTCRPCTPPVGVCNHLEDRTDPLGYCVEVFHPEALRWLATVAERPDEREHVTLGFKYRDLYAPFTILDGEHAALRWTVDTEADFAYMSAMFEALGEAAPAEQALAWAAEHPHPSQEG